MIDLFHAIHACRDLIHYWDVARTGEGVVVRARSRQPYDSKQAAEEVASEIAARIRPEGHDLRDVSAAAKRVGRGDGWHAVVEVLVV
jgi:hypothetical protein